MDQALAVVEQKEVAFYGDTVVAVRVQGGGVFVPVRPICDLLGVDWSAQRQRLGRDAVLAGLTMSVVVTTTDIPPDSGPRSRRPRTSEMLALPLDYISGFLFGINADRVKPEVRDRLIRYQRECYRVLAEAFSEGRLTADPSFDDLLAAAGPETVQAYQVAQAVLQLARNQVMLEAQLRGVLELHEQRLEAVEAQLRLDSARYVTEEQASQISQAVKAVAVALSQKSGRNEFGGVYGEMYRKFGISGYKMLPARRFEEAMRWLAEWYQQVTGQQGLPF